LILKQGTFYQEQLKLLYHNYSNEFEDFHKHLLAQLGDEILWQLQADQCSQHLIKFLVTVYFRTGTRNSIYQNISLVLKRSSNQFWTGVHFSSCVSTRLIEGVPSSDSASVKGERKRQVSVCKYFSKSSISSALSVVSRNSDSA